ncbi:hypothetical protein PG989_015447 [Apiospora arundinis]|uniref:Cation transport protein-domain-containing protein n=1 Tax=Apiospora arundinis TaxID=335852 RepID=A0ABR2JK16_9PEZI
MWRPQLDYITLHYTWIICCSILGLIIIYPYGNVSAIDAYFFGASASTESGLNTFDVKDLKTYQQVYIYLIPIITNVGFVNIMVVAVRLYWFKKKFKAVAPSYWRPDPEAVVFSLRRDNVAEVHPPQGPEQTSTSKDTVIIPQKDDKGTVDVQDSQAAEEPDTTYYIPPPRERDNGKPFTARGAPRGDDDGDEIKPVPPPPFEADREGLKQRRPVTMEGPKLATARSIQSVARSVLVLGSRISSESRGPPNVSRFPRPSELPTLSKQVTIGRNSRLYNLTEEDKEKLGGIEYRALKMLMKIVPGYFFGLHLFGVICLVPWIHRAPAKYTEWLAECGQDKTWWAFYSAQTMVDNLGFTLTPDSMITFRDATWPLLVMTFLAFAGNTLYPVLLRLCIYVIYKLVPTRSSAKESLRFLLDHPRRCYTLLFPSRPTWILFSIVFALNFVDVLLIVALDLDNPAVNDLAMGPRIVSAVFQAASSRHTGASTLNLASINPAVQFSLLVMMYIAILPIAISIRSSNAYEERALGVYESQRSLDETNASKYVKMHVRNQLGFDLWYIFLGTFCVCIAESARIVDLQEPAFSVFSVFFEVVSAYGNVGLSLGHPTVNTSLSGQFTVFSKLVICAMMIRGRHRGLPYSLDRAILLPGEGEGGQEDDGRRIVHSSRN